MKQMCLMRNTPPNDMKDLIFYIKIFFGQFFFQKVWFVSIIVFP